MSIDVSSLAQASLTAQGLSNLILVSPQTNYGFTPQLPAGTTGSTAAKTFLFDFEGEQSEMLESDIPDHWAEDLSAVNDMISNKPILVNTHGFVGELNNVPPAALALLKTAADKLTAISGLQPQLSATALIAYNTALQAYQTGQQIASAAVSAWGSIGGASSSGLLGALSSFANQNKQQAAYLMFVGYRAQKMLFTVQTPWAVHKNMAIKTMRPVQDEDTRVITRFEMTFKEFRMAGQLQTTSPQMAGRAGDASSIVNNQGVVNPAPGLTLGQQLSANNLAVG